MCIAPAVLTQVFRREEIVEREKCIQISEIVQDSIIKKLAALSVVVEDSLSQGMINSYKGIASTSEDSCFSEKLKSCGYHQADFLHGDRDRKHSVKLESRMNLENDDHHSETELGGNFFFTERLSPSDERFELAVESLTSYSMTDPFGESSSPGMSQQSNEFNIESTLESCSMYCGELAIMGRKSLSIHFSGKSKSFAALSDVVKVTSIQELAKPKRFTHSRRKKGLEGSSMRSIHKLIKKQTSRTKASRFEYKSISLGS